jgi:hypothetical protein
MKGYAGFYGSLLAILLLLPALPAKADPRRYALVIGNSNYAKIEKLRTPANDAADIAEVLKRLGYTVDIKLNVGIDQMENAILEFTDRLALDRENEGFFWYAGHGVQVEGENYLLPVDIQAERITQVRRAAYSLTDILRGLESARNKVNVVILDACRNNPLPAENRTLARGLSAAPVIQDTFVMFSTAAGATASDGDPNSRNSPFTEAFLKNMEKPLPIETLAKDIAVETIEITKVNQRPYISDNILYARGYTLNPAGIPAEARIQPIPPATSEVRPRPQPEQPQLVRQPADAGKFSLDNTRAMNFGFFGNGFVGPGGGNRGFAAGGGAAFRFAFWEGYKKYGTFSLVPNLFFVEGNYIHFGNKDYYGQSVNAGHISMGFLYRIRLGAAQRFIFSVGTSVGPMVSGFTWDTKYDDEDKLLPAVIIGIHADLPYAELSFRFTPAWSLDLGLGVSADIYAFATDNPGMAGLRGRLGLAYRKPRQ